MADKYSKLNFAQTLFAVVFRLNKIKNSDVL